MGATSVERLRERFERDGHVELGLHPAKVTLHLLFLLVLPVGVVLVAATGGRVVLALALVFVAWFLVAVGARYAEQLFGSGPALRLDRRGLTLRRWREPLVLEWTEVCSLLPYRPRRLVGPLVAILLSQWVWHDYRAARPVSLRRIDRLTRVRKPYLVPLKVLDASAADILALADRETIDRLTEITPPYRLVLDLGEGGESPLWLRGGREAPLARLPLRPELVTAVRAWNHEVVGLLERPPGGEGFTQALAAAGASGRSLAAELQADLGPGAEVLFAGDVPR
jgi:hypothetical protein